jgi:hypothetical protein
MGVCVQLVSECLESMMRRVGCELKSIVCRVIRELLETLQAEQS